MTFGDILKIKHKFYKDKNYSHNVQGPLSKPRGYRRFDIILRYLRSKREKLFALATGFLVLKIVIVLIVILLPLIIRHHN
jgi:hypothetical protein